MSRVLIMALTCWTGFAVVIGSTPGATNRPSLYDELDDSDFTRQLEKEAEDDKLRAEWRNRFAAADYEYDIAALKHRRASLHWQLTSSKIIFWVVIGIVLSGIIFSALQFRIALTLARRRQSPKGEVAIAAEPAVTSLKASWQGIEVSSSLLGVIILIISLLFFALYLKFIYPVTELTSTPDVTPALASEK
jgi:hypothetical protein